MKAGPLAAAGGGVLLVWSGIRGRSWSTVLRDVIGGHAPSVATTAYRIEPGTPDDGSAVFGGGTFPVSGNAGPLSSTAQSIGPRMHYVFGGVPSLGEVDCSSLINITCATLKLAVPFDKHYAGATHGPNTVAWLAWTGCAHVPYAQRQADDLIVWQTHMGVLTGRNTMYSALSQRSGIKETTIKEGSPGGEIPFIRRHKGGRMAVSSGG